MKLLARLKEEVVAVVMTTLYFAVCFGVMVAVKRLLLAEYAIEFRGLSLALLGALVVAKVVLVFEHVPLGHWVERQPPIVEILLRTILYTAGAAVALVLERSFEERHEHGGWGAAATWIFQHRQPNNLWANVICVSCALFGFNVIAALRERIGDRQLLKMYFAAPSGEGV
jgi:hypothetical protein